MVKLEMLALEESEVLVVKESSQQKSVALGVEATLPAIEPDVPITEESLPQESTASKLK